MPESNKIVETIYTDIGQHEIKKEKRVSLVVLGYSEYDSLKDHPDKSISYEAANYKTIFGIPILIKKDRSSFYEIR